MSNEKEETKKSTQSEEIREELRAQYPSASIVPQLPRSFGSIGSQLRDGGPESQAMQGINASIKRIREFVSESHSVGGRNALHIAALCGDLGIVQVLWRHRSIRPDAKDDLGNTALHLAAKNGHAAVVGFLCCPNEEGVPVSQYDCLGGNDRHVLHDAADSGDPETLACLPRYPEIASATICQDGDGQTPLHVAVSRGHEEAARVLYQADQRAASVINKQGETVVDLANEHADSRLRGVLSALFSSTQAPSGPTFFRAGDQKQTGDLPVVSQALGPPGRS